MIASLHGLGYRYPSGTSPALDCVGLDVAEGQFALLAGPSAGGKSTLLRVFNGLVPQFHGGTLGGTVTVAGLDPTRTPARRMATVAGMVFQEPESQAITDIVEDEIAFGMEQQAFDRETMRRRLDAVLEQLAIEHLRHRALATLSGGERQRVAIAAVLALEPRILLLDEPTSQLDPGGADAVLAALDALHRERGLTVLLAEHRLERLLPRCDTVIEVESGRVRTLSPRAAARELRAVPAVCRLARLLHLDPMPLTVEDARALLAHRKIQLQYLEIGHIRRDRLPLSTAVERGSGGEGAPGDELLRVTGLTAAYGDLRALHDATFTLREGEVIALLGPNGSGKSTLFRALSGLVQPVAGEVLHRGRPAARGVADRTAFAGLVPQDPAIALYRETVREEVAETARNRRRPTPSLEDWGIAQLADRNPRDVSVGQQQRIAIAAMLAHEPRVWMLDEPTRGADAAAKQWLADRLARHAAAGGAAIVATHDIESAARFATRVIALDHGEIVHDLPARHAFGNSGPFPTQTARLVPGAILPEEVAP